MTVNGNQGGAVNYEPNVMGGPTACPKSKWSPIKVSGETGRFWPKMAADDFTQVTTFYKKTLTESDRVNLIKNISGHLGGARKDLQVKAIKMFYKIDPDYGTRVAKELGIPAEQARM